MPQLPEPPRSNCAAPSAVCATCLLALCAHVALPPSIRAQSGPIEIQLTETAEDSTYRAPLMGSGFSVVRDGYAFYAFTSNPRGGVAWFGQPPDEFLAIPQDFNDPPPDGPQLEFCPYSVDPSTWDPRLCIESIGLSVSTSGCPSGNNCGYWLMVPGFNPLPPDPIYGIWPQTATIPNDPNSYGTPGYLPRFTSFDIDDISTLLPSTGPGKACYCHLNETTQQCESIPGFAGNPGERATGVSNSKTIKVIYPDGTYRWYMAFNTQHRYIAKNNGATNHANGADKWRVGWAYSDDGFNWTIHDQLILRSALERRSPAYFQDEYNFNGPNGTKVFSPDGQPDHGNDFCDEGFLVTDMFQYGNKAYIVFYPPGTNFFHVNNNPNTPPLGNGDPRRGNVVYLARVNLQNYATTGTAPTSGPGFVESTWAIATLPLVNGHWTWASFEPGDLLDLDGDAVLYPGIDVAPADGQPDTHTREIDAATILEYPNGSAFQGSFNKQTQVVRVFTASDPQSPSRFIALSEGRENIGGIPPSKPVLQLYSSADPEAPFTYESDVPSPPKGVFSYEFTFDHYPHNEPVTPQIVDGRFHIWFAQDLRPCLDEDGNPTQACDTLPRSEQIKVQSFVRRTASLAGSIFGSHTAPCAVFIDSPPLTGAHSYTGCSIETAPGLALTSSASVSLNAPVVSIGSDFTVEAGATLQINTN